MFRKETMRRGWYSIVAPLVVAITFLICTNIFSADITKTTSFHHSVTENGNIQVRKVTKYIKDGKVKNKKHSKPMTPADTKDMTGWDKKSKNIVAVIITPEVLAAFEAEKQIMTGVGIEEIVTYDRVVDDLERISIRRITRIFDEGIEISKKYHRSWIMPGQDPSENDVMSKAIAKKLHTPEVIEAYKAKIAEQFVP